MDLKSELVSYRKVDYNDLNDFISFHYGVEFDVVADQEMSNDSKMTVTVEPEEILDYDQEKLDRLRERNDYPTYSLHVLLQDLCNRGHLAAGQYLICVSW